QVRVFRRQLAADSPLRHRAAAPRVRRGTFSGESRRVDPARKPIPREFVLDDRSRTIFLNRPRSDRRSFVEYGTGWGATGALPQWRLIPESRPPLPAGGRHPKIFGGRAGSP